MKALTIVATAALLSSCGGGGGGVCADVPACGGTIAPGRYRATCGSYSGTMTWRECPMGIAIVSSDVMVGGTYTFSADGTIAKDLTTAGTIVQSVPLSCARFFGPAATCEQLGPLMQGGGTGTTVTCTGTDPCQCTSTISDHQVGTGTYQTSGTSLYIMTSDFRTPSLTDYCATPTTLTLTRNNEVGDLTGPMDSTFRSVLVYTKE